MGNLVHNEQKRFYASEQNINDVLPWSQNIPVKLSKNTDMIFQVYFPSENITYQAYNCISTKETRIHTRLVIHTGIAFFSALFTITLWWNILGGDRTIQSFMWRRHRITFKTPPPRLCVDGWWWDIQHASIKMPTFILSQCWHYSEILSNNFWPSDQTADKK